VDAARELAPVLARRKVALALTSPLSRARRTAELAGLGSAEPDEDLVEWDYGGYEGITTAEIRADRPGWDLWRDGVPSGSPGSPGENAAQIGARADRVLARARAVLAEDRGDVVAFAHGHLLRVLAARWLGLPPEQGALFALDTATVSTLGFEHAYQVVRAWNVPALACGEAFAPPDDSRPG
jgi:probable phosphoglycerate mutase